MFQIPLDIQRLIFEMAAKADVASARVLVQVSTYVKDWIQPILYQTIILRSPNAITSLLIALSADSPPKPPITSLGISCDALSPTAAKPLLALVSTSLTSAVLFGTHRSPAPFLPFFRGGAHLRSLSLFSPTPAELSLPPAVLSSLSHLALLGGPYTWLHLRQAARSPTHAATFNALTHVAVDARYWGALHTLLKVARALRVFAILTPPDTTPRATANLRLRVRELADPRVVLVEHEFTLQSWEASQRNPGTPGIWEAAEARVGAAHDLSQSQSVEPD